jgi:DNA-binding transcriptional regulator/RsmH inhibitor MraZ
MITDKRKLDEFYRKLDAKEKLSVKQAFRIYDALHKEAVALGAISHENIWDGFEVDLRIARAMGKMKRARKTDKKNSRKVRRR